MVVVRSEMREEQTEEMMSSSKQAAEVQWVAPESREQGKSRGRYAQGVGRLTKDKEMVKRM